VDIFLEINHVLGEQDDLEEIYILAFVSFLDKFSQIASVFGILVRLLSLKFVLLLHEVQKLSFEMVVIIPASMKNC